jgi:PAS domain S-box-containing protein
VILKSEWQRLAFALAMTVLAAVLTAVTTDISRAPLFLYFFGAVLLSAYAGGTPSALLSTLVSIVISVWMFIRPIGSGIEQRDDAIRLVAFTVMSLLTIAITVRMQRAVEQERLLRNVIETTPLLTVVTDSSGHIELFNPSCEQLTGYTEAEVIGKSLTDTFVPPEWVAVVAQRFENPDDPEVIRPHENPWRTKRGELRVIEWRCRILHRRHSGPLILGIGVDVTERRHNLELLMEAERVAARTSIIHELAHELNNPLQSLTNAVALLETDSSAAPRYARIIANELQRVSTLSKRLLSATAMRPAKSDGDGSRISRSV